MKTIDQLKRELKEAKLNAYKNAKSKEEVLAIWKQDKRMSIPMETKRRFFCSGCRQNFYNGNNGIGVSQCWSLEQAKLKERKIYASLNSTKPDEVITLSCYTQEYH